MEKARKGPRQEPTPPQGASVSSDRCAQANAFRPIVRNLVACARGIGGARSGPGCPIHRWLGAERDLGRNRTLVGIDLCPLVIPLFAALGKVLALVFRPAATDRAPDSGVQACKVSV
jgi:hypothetical protein